MGKSTFLKHMSKLLKESSFNNHASWLIRLNLNDHTVKLEQFTDTSFSFDSAIDFLSGKLLSFETKFEQELFKLNIRLGKAIIMFDGFDEISPTYKNIVINLLQTLNNNRIKQLWITTRPNMREVLEDNLNQFAYNLEPFSKKDQINFLTKYWMHKLNISVCDSTKLKTYAEALLDNLGKSMIDKELTGIALQSRMLAEVFEKECNSFYNSDQLQPELNAKLNLIDLYEKFLNSKFEININEKMKLVSSNTQIKEDFISKMIEEYKTEYQLLALYAIFNKKDIELLLDERQLQIIRKFFQDFKEGKKNIGIINQIVDKDKPKFIHRTFAEYFITIYFINCLKNTQSSEKFKTIAKFIIEKILQESYYKVIRAFLSSWLKKNLIKKEKEYEYEDELFKEFKVEIQNLWQSDKMYQNLCRSILRIAVFENNSGIIYILPENLLMIEVDDDGTALHIASSFAKLEIVELLLQKGAEIETKNGKREETALHIASSFGELEAIKLLLKKGAKIEATNRRGETALHIAAYNSKSDIAELLLQNGANIEAYGYGKTALHIAASTGNSKVLELLLQNNAKIGATVLHEASRRGKSEIVELLLKKGAEIEAEDEKGNTALHIAAKSIDKPEIADILINYNAKIEAKNKTGETALHIATDFEKSKVVDCLLQRRADVEALNNLGKTALHLAAKFNEPKIVDLLIKFNAKIEAKDPDGNTALHIAVYNDKSSVAKILLQKGANKEAKNARGETALHIACRSKKPEIVDLLINYNAKIEAKDPDGNTALHIAVYNDKSSVAKILLQKGANKEAKNARGETALHIACKRKKLEIVNLFTESC
jgi:ankyrin repeat protein